MKAIYPGSFDPITFGHVDIIRRAAQMFDEVVVVVLINDANKPLFTVEERVEMLKETVGSIANVQVKASRGLTVDFARKEEAKVIIEKQIKDANIISDYSRDSCGYGL